MIILLMLLLGVPLVLAMAPLFIASRKFRRAQALNFRQFRVYLTGVWTRDVQ